MEPKSNQEQNLKNVMLVKEKEVLIIDKEDSWFKCNVEHVTEKEQ
jgi:hypothetical protein